MESTGKKGRQLRPLCRYVGIYCGPSSGSLTFCEVMRRLQAEVHDVFPGRHPRARRRRRQFRQSAANMTEDPRWPTAWPLFVGGILPRQHAPADQTGQPSRPRVSSECGEPSFDLPPRAEPSRVVVKPNWGVSVKRGSSSHGQMDELVPRRWPHTSGHFCTCTCVIGTHTWQTRKMKHSPVAMSSQLRLPFFFGGDWAVGVC